MFCEVLCTDYVTGSVERDLITKCLLHIQDYFLNGQLIK